MSYPKIQWLITDIVILKPSTVTIVDFMTTCNVALVNAEDLGFCFILITLQ